METETRSRCSGEGEENVSKVSRLLCRVSVSDYVEVCVCESAWKLLTGDYGSGGGGGRCGIVDR